MKELEGQAYHDAVIERDRNLRHNPIDLFLETISCRDKASGKITEYKVIDCGTSALTGDYHVLQGGEGQKEQVTSQELFEMLV